MRQHEYRIILTQLYDDAVEYTTPFWRAKEFQVFTLNHTVSPY